MIDIHSHILPGVDDGSEDMYDSLLMAQIAADSGVTDIVITPHANIQGVYENVHNAEYMKNYMQLQAQISLRELPIRIYPGMEIFLVEKTLPKIASGELISLNHSGRYLVEFSFQRSMTWMTEQLYELRRAGVKLIVAHPERYESIQHDPSRCQTWIDMGCQLQMNRGSIFGRFGRSVFEAADSMLRNNCITYVASDAHGPNQRTPHLADVYQMLATEFSPAMADRLLRENQERYILHKQD